MAGLSEVIVDGRKLFGSTPESNRLRFGYTFGLVASERVCIGGVELNRLLTGNRLNRYHGAIRRDLAHPETNRFIHVGSIPRAAATAATQ